MGAVGVDQLPLEGRRPAAPSRCPRHAKAATGVHAEVRGWVAWESLWGESFRLFFPLALVAGLGGVLIWPLVIWGWVEASPVLVHTRLMALGFLGGFVLGFVGTSLPRLLGAPAFTAWETLPLLAVHLLVCGSYLMGAIALGDWAMMVNLAGFAVVLGLRVRQRKQLPAPGFLMLIPAGVTLSFGLGLARLQAGLGWGFEWDLLVRLFLYHGFVLLCVLAAGGFLLPRFLGLGLRRRYSGEGQASPVWKRSAVVSLGVGLGIPLTYGLDCLGESGWGSVVRALLVVSYLVWEMPVERFRVSWQGVDWILVLGILCLPLGILLAGWLPGYRVGLSHVEIALGFGLITVGIATRVVLGHTGHRELLERFHPWVSLAAVLMVVGTLLRVGGDLLPSGLVSFYGYGALCWVSGGIVWGICVLRHVLKRDPEG